MGAVSNSKEGDMLGYFNTASLANLTKAELQSLLATYQAKLLAADNETDRAQTLSEIATIRRYLHNAP